MTERPKMDFVGRHLCFGDMNTLMEKSKDPANCPTCAANQEYPDYGFYATRRFAMHVVQYKVQPGGFKVQTPFQAELVVWSFTDQRFSQLTDIAEEHGDLRQRDLLLGPCENKTFQKFDLQVGGSAAWLETDAAKEFVTTLYASNKVEDLNVAMGRKISRAEAQDDIQKVILRNQQAFGGGGAAEAPSSAPDVSQQSMDLEGLLGGGSASAAPEAPAAAPEAPVVDLPTPSPEPEAPAAAEGEKKAFDFDALMKGL